MAISPHEGLVHTARRTATLLAHDLTHPSHPPTPLLADARSPWLRRLPYAVAGVFVTVLLPVTITALPAIYGMPGPFAALLALFQVLPLLLAVSRPLQAWWIVFCADVAGALLLLLVTDPPGHLPWPWSPMEIIGYLVLMVGLGLRENRRTLFGVWVVTGAVSLALVMITPLGGDATGVVLFVLSGVVLLISGTVRERGDAQRRLAEQETISEAERARRTLLEERTRIARELHDVVAHHMSVITVQADSAPYRIAGLPKAAEEEFGTIAATARESLAEMRRLLGVLRSEGAEGERTPQPGLERLPPLVEATVRAGVPAALTVSAQVAALDSVPQAVDLSAYRIVQEALANVVRHAPGATTRVSVSTDGTSLTVLVVNGPAPEAGAPLEPSGTGHGLVGMRERVRLVDGTLDTGPLPDGGFKVAAQLPLRDEELDTV